MDTIQIKSLETIGDTANAFIRQMNGNKIFAFYGSMGAGKTTFIKELCRQLGVKDVVNSPTFSIINEYDMGADKKIFHFDFYRINAPEEALNFGVEDYFYSGNICFIEWPDKIDALLPQEHVKVYITEFENGIRNIEFG